MPYGHEVLRLQEHVDLREKAQDAIGEILAAAGELDSAIPPERGVNSLAYVRASLDQFRAGNVGNMLGMLGLIHSVAELERGDAVVRYFDDLYEKDPAFRASFDGQLATLEARK